MPAAPATEPYIFQNFATARGCSSHGPLLACQRLFSKTKKHPNNKGFQAEHTLAERTHTQYNCSTHISMGVGVVNMAKSKALTAFDEPSLRALVAGLSASTPHAAACLQLDSAFMVSAAVCTRVVIEHVFVV